MTDSAIKKQIKQIVEKADATATTILFGSRARGTAAADADWDILILLNKSDVSIKDEQMFRHKLYDLELRIGIAISTIVYSLHDWTHKFAHTPLHHNVQREGIIL